MFNTWSSVWLRWDLSLLTAATARHAFCQRSFSSTSATDTLNLFRILSFKLRSECLFALSESLSGTCISMVQTPINIHNDEFQIRFHFSSQLSRHLVDDVSFYNIADLDIV